jgi:hypothetical protein
VTNISGAESATGLMRQFIFEDMIESRRISSRQFLKFGLNADIRSDCKSPPIVSGGASQWKCDGSRRARP